MHGTRLSASRRKATHLLTYKVSLWKAKEECLASRLTAASCFTFSRFPSTQLSKKSTTSQMYLKSPSASTLAGNVEICVCWLYPSNDRHFCLLPTCQQCRPDTSATFCYVVRFLGCRRRVGEICCQHTLLHICRNQY
jgi:hypothetical protein